MKNEQFKQDTQIKLNKKQSHQIKALFYKNASLQWKQPCTNICQIFTPIICLIFTIMIRNVAVEHLPTDQNNIYNQIPAFPQKFNDFQILNQLDELVFSFDCSRWLLYDCQQQKDRQFIGLRDGINPSTGMLRHILKTNTYSCFVNQSFNSEFRYTLRDVPYFRSPNISINNEIYQRYLYFNKLTTDDLRSSNAVQKMPDGAVYFYQASKQSLNFDLKVNDQRDFELHYRNALTKISVCNPLDPLHSGWQTYYTIPEGFLQLLDMITFSYFKQSTMKQFVSGYIYMPLTSGSSSFIQALINIVATIIFPLSLSLLLPVFLYNIVLQKQTKIIQMMRMNGLSILTYWLVNFMFNVIISLLTYAAFYSFGYFYMESVFFKNTSVMLFWIILVGWMLCQIGMSMLFQVLISNSRAANIIGYLITIWTNLIGATLSVAMFQYPVAMPFSITLWPTIAFNRLFYLMFINCSSDHCYDSLSALPNEAVNCIYVIYISAFIFMGLGMYLFEVIPQQFGISKSLIFPIQFLFKKQNTKISLNINQEQFNKEYDKMIEEQNGKVNQNKFTDHALVCQHLTKVYQNGKQATIDFSLILQDNQVFGLLGPNGAGKTTLISMITGIFSPSTGTAYVAGYNIKTEIDSVHMNMGVCPQFDILWDELTVEEHLYFYARLRGTPSSMEKSKVEQILSEVSLAQFATFKVKQLSGGMKRRLSVAISLVGDPRVVFLDEPTTGLDPENRRNLWELLSKCKNKRSLFLTTHLMDEAQSLCDRVGIITDGRLRTVGDQMSLKKTYGKGYCLTISLQIERQPFHNVIQSSYLDQMMNGQQYLQDYPQLSSQCSQKSRVSVMSVNQQNETNIMVNDSISSSQYNYEQMRKKVSNYARLQNTRMRRNSPDQQIQQNQHFQINLGHEAKVYTSRQLAQLNKFILKRFSSEEFIFSSSNISISYEEECSVKSQAPYIVKQLNGTVQFNLGYKVKISKVLEQLNRMKKMTYEQIINFEHNSKKNPLIQSYDTLHLKQQNKDLMQFQWAISNSSLEDVFIQVVKKYQANSNSTDEQSI